MKKTSNSPEISVRDRHREQFSPSFIEVKAESGFIDKVKLFVSWLQRLRIMRSLTRYGNGRGALLAGGIAYSAIFSLAAALTIGITVLLGVLGRSPQLQDAVFSSLASSLPGVLEWKGSSGIVNPSDLVVSTSFSITGIVAVVVLVFSATSVMHAMKSSIRAMFGIDQVPSGAASEKLRDLLGFVAIALGVGATGILTLAHTVIGTQVFSAIGLESALASMMIRIGSFLISAAIDGLILWILIRFVALVRAPKTDLWWGLAGFGLVASLIRSLGTSAVGSVDNPLLASFAAIATLLLWINLLSRVMLIACAFIANPPKALKVSEAEDVHATERPNYVSLSEPLTLDWAHHRISGAVDLDVPADTSLPDHLALGQAPLWRSRLVSQSGKPWRGKVSALIDQMIARHEKRIAFLRSLKDGRRDPR
ncbi:YhjD/YihY/BrkB family envelope integrity protein [Varibaculum cambriense]|uniref:YihY/virulence factor BrkB family protein n=1 Tax=Varibaculum cambriense TaxID=184870 RepID=UPI00290D73D6|nr:YhjD/YihY/BrkB family envelope integrity protein [Varibaculum cambriense]MDU5542143.1 YhjD/YihY/BrkB family envelope integrity protein [Varibaculum cambriense]